MNKQNQILAIKLTALGMSKGHKYEYGDLTVYRDGRKCYLSAGGDTTVYNLPIFDHTVIQAAIDFCKRAWLRMEMK